MADMKTKTAKTETEADVKMEALRQATLMAQAQAMLDPEFVGDPVEAGMDILLSACFLSGRKAAG